MPAFDNNETAETVIGNSMNSLRKIVDRPCLLVNKLNVRKKRIWHVPRPEANAVCSSEFVPFSSHSSDLSFIKISLLSERITAYLESCSSGSSNSQKRVTPEIIMSSEIIAPSLAEQRRIGAFFDRLDSLITLHQRKYDKLCVLKKSMLDKMFPKGGSLYPEIRFAGFTDPWEQRKLGELYQKNDERNTDGLGSERTLSVASMTFNSAGNGADDSSLPNYKRLRLGDIAFEGHANKEFAYGRFVLNDAGNGIMSPRFTCLRPIVEQEYSFWKYFIHSEKVMRPILVNSTKSGTMMNELVVEDFLKQEILVPSLPEQRRIGAFFDRLDSLITLHQRKYCGVASWMLGVALVRLGSESDGAFGEMKHVLR